VEIFQAYKKLKDVKKVMNEINERYASDVGKLSVQHVRRILSNRIYMGHPSYGKEEIANPALTMVPRELFGEVQQLLGEKAKKFRVKKARKPHSILDDWARKFGLDYVARVLDVLKAHCPRCKDVHMIGDGSKVIHGVIVPRFKCPSCGYLMPVPSGAKIECFVGADLLICPNSKCRSVENFTVMQLVDGSYEYACVDCGVTFRTDISPDVSARRLLEPEQFKRGKKVKKKSLKFPSKVKRSTKGTSRTPVDGKFKIIDEFLAKS